MTEPTAASSTETARERALEGLDHLQSAARELINAARAALDVAEHLIDDPEMVATMVGAAGKFGELLRTVASERPPRPTATDGVEGTNPDDGPGFESTGTTVERIALR